MSIIFNRLRCEPFESVEEKTSSPNNERSSTLPSSGSARKVSKFTKSDELGWAVFNYARISPLPATESFSSGRSLIAHFSTDYIFAGAERISEGIKTTGSRFSLSLSLSNNNFLAKP